MVRFAALFVSMVFLVGCSSTTSQPSVVNQLQIKVAQLERKVSERDQDVEDLKFQIAEISHSIDGLDHSSIEEPVTLPVIRDEKTASSSKKVSKASSSSTSSSASSPETQYIRVSAESKQVQLALQNAGYYFGSIDGKVGRQTRDAVKEFQKDHNLKSDGVVGQKTWSELKNYLE